MSEADQIDKLYWKLAKEDFEARTRGIPDAPTWDKLTDGQRNSLRMLAEHRAERRRAEPLAAVKAWHESYPELTRWIMGRRVSPDDIEPDRMQAADLEMTPRRRAFKNLASKILDGRVLTSDDVRPAPRSMQDRLNGLGYNQPPGWDDGAHDAYREDD